MGRDQRSEPIPRYGVALVQNRDDFPLRLLDGRIPLLGDGGALRHRNDANARKVRADLFG